VNGGEPVTVMIARRVAPGREAEFERWARELTMAGSRFDGFLGAGLLRPGRVGHDWHVVFRFDSPQTLAAWESSPTRAALLARGEDVMHTTSVQRVSGLETWFALPGLTAPAPPRWKMFLVSMVGIYSLQLAVYLGLGAPTPRLPLALRLAVFVPIVTAAMTWLVMPRLARLLADWLYAARGREHDREDRRGDRRGGRR
jgi:antibiotic biosynthesis monooxygenase (ABM) superfamily enzyme